MKTFTFNGTHLVQEPEFTDPRMFCDSKGKMSKHQRKLYEGISQQTREENKNLQSYLVPEQYRTTWQVGQKVSEVEFEVRRRLYSGNQHQWQDDFDLELQGELNEDVEEYAIPLPGKAEQEDLWNEARELVSYGAGSYHAELATGIADEVIKKLSEQYTISKK